MTEKPPRTVEWITEHQDQIADEFENYEPQPGDERDPQLLKAVTAAVAAARAAGYSELIIRSAARNAAAELSGTVEFTTADEPYLSPTAGAAMTEPEPGGSGHGAGAGCAARPEGPAETVAGVEEER